jgi:hypothetical protein
MEMNSHFGGDDAGKSGFAQPRWPSEQKVIDRLFTSTRRFEHDSEVFFEFTLTDELVERAWS